MKSHEYQYSENKMMSKMKHILSIAGFCFVLSIQAQEPFKELGLDNEVEVITLSNGRYIEHFENDTLRQIGSVMFNMITNKVEYIIPEDDLEKVRIIKRNREVSRFLSIDPLSRNFPWNSPYAFAENRPIDAIDLEGLEALMIVGVQYLSDGRAIIQIVPDNEVEHNASADFRLRIPKGVIGNETEEIYTRDGLGNPDYGYAELQSYFGGGKLSKQKDNDNLLFKGELKAYAVPVNPSQTPGAKYQDVIIGKILVSQLTPNTRILVPVSVPFNFSNTGDFSGPNRTQNFTYTAPSSANGMVQINLNYDDNGIINTFSVVDNSGNIMNDASGNPMTSSGVGTFSFSVSSGTNFTIQVTGNPSLGTGDAFDLNGSGTTTVNAIATP